MFTHSRMLILEVLSFTSHGDMLIWKKGKRGRLIFKWGRGRIWQSDVSFVVTFVGRTKGMCCWNLGFTVFGFRENLSLASDDMAGLRRQGIDVGDDNDRAPQNIPAH